MDTSALWSVYGLNVYIAAIPKFNLLYSATLIFTLFQSFIQIS